MTTHIARPISALAALVLLGLAAPVRADDQPAPDEIMSFHGQATFVDLYHPAFRSPYTSVGINKTCDVLAAYADRRPIKLRAVTLRTLHR